MACSCRCAVTVLTCFWSVAFLAGAIITLSTLYLSKQGPAKECYGKFGPKIYLHRGNLTAAQENTLGSVVGAAALGANPEIDIEQTSDGQAVLHHDLSLIRMTGVDKGVRETPWSEIQTLAVKSVIDGYDYGGTEAIPLLTDAVQGICAAMPTAGIDFDLKASFAVKPSVSVLKSSNCTTAQGGSTESSSIFATGDPLIARNVVAELKAHGMDNYVSLFLHPGLYGQLGLYFFLKTGLFHQVAGVSMISLHKTVWDKEADLIKSYEEAGWCTGIYGIRPNEVSQYPSASYFVVDEGPLFPDTPNGQYGGDFGTDIVEYDGSRMGFNGLLAFGILCFPISFLCCCFTCCLIRRSSKTA
eukprot:TRINITY_DN52484_c0_g1_i1.p1 TRINITY_DN52484_c0_g1~~TRINITY_DN52484_c0_g1_i1.p1  ORF type:complete len:357 (+),score=50.64 TRINITY_DN52484_c0_g1_i1:106-1176(+)